jgi:hypothetical protein
MVRQIEIKIFPDKLHDEPYIQGLILQKVKAQKDDIKQY